MSISFCIIRIICIIYQIILLIYQIILLNINKMIILVYFLRKSGIIDTDLREELIKC